MANNTEEDRIRQVLTDFRAGKIDKYAAMDELDLDDWFDLQDLLVQYGIGPELTPDFRQSDPSAKPLKDFFTEGS